jgi:hypothetical protein
MEDAGSLDAQHLEPWYPSVWSGTTNHEHVSDAVARRRDEAGNRADAPRRARFENAFDPIFAAVQTIEPVEHDEADEPYLEGVEQDEAEELNLDGVFEDIEDFPAVRFDVGLWGENGHAAAEPNDETPADPWSGTEAPADEPSDADPSLHSPPDRWVFTAKGHRAGRSAKRRKASSAPGEEAVGTPEGKLEEPSPVAGDPVAEGPSTEPPRAERHRVRRGGRHRRGRVRQVPEAEPAAFLSEEREPTFGAQAVLVGIPEGSRFRPVVRVLAIAVPVAGATMAFVTYLR